MFKAAAKVEDKSIRIIFLKIGDQEVQKKRFSSARASKDHCVRSVFAMQVQVVRGPVIGFEDRQIFLLQVAVDLVPGMQGKEQRKVGVVGIQNKHGAEIKG